MVVLLNIEIVTIRNSVSELALKKKERKFEEAIREKSRCSLITRGTDSEIQRLRTANAL